MTFNPRITSGRYKNQTLAVPSSARPLTDRVKKTIFDVLADFVVDSRCLDLFAGSGNFGIEALSRGATHSTFVDNNEGAIQNIHKNIQSIGIDKEFYSVRHMSYLRFAEEATEKFDLIFLDPPFRKVKIALDIVLSILSKEGVIIFRYAKENEKRIKIPKTLEIVASKEIGISKVLFLKSDPKERKV